MMKDGKGMDGSAPIINQTPIKKDGRKSYGRYFFKLQVQNRHGHIYIWGPCPLERVYAGVVWCIRLHFDGRNREIHAGECGLILNQAGNASRIAFVVLLRAERTDGLILTQVAGPPPLGLGSRFDPIACFTII